MTHKKSTFCILPWMHAQIKPNGQIKPCCRFDHRHNLYRKEDGSFKFEKFNINKTTFIEALQSQEWEEIRQQMFNGEEVPGCRKCYHEEHLERGLSKDFGSSGMSRSLRSIENRLWNGGNQDFFEGTEKKEIRFLELALGTFCNLKCRTCASDLSSSWIEDESKLAGFYKDRAARQSKFTIETEWNLVDFEHVEEVKFTGGEPMMHPNFIKIIDLILSMGRQHLIELDIYTNTSWFPSSSLLERLKQFKAIRINLSIDGVGKVNDYLRPPSQWPLVEASALQWLKQEREHPDIFKILWVPCISIYNVWQFREMIEWWLDLQIGMEPGKFSSPKNNIIVNVLQEPKYLSLSNYPDKNELIEWLMEHKKNINSRFSKEIISTEKIYDKVIGALNAPMNKDLLQVFIEYTADLDNIRNDDLRVDIPFLWDKLKKLVEYKGRIPN